jgi:hypothetical protein
MITSKDRVQGSGLKDYFQRQGWVYYWVYG